jgi:hypothetical protein
VKRKKINKFCSDVWKGRKRPASGDSQRARDWEILAGLNQKSHSSRVIVSCPASFMLKADKVAASRGISRAELLRRVGEPSPYTLGQSFWDDDQLVWWTQVMLKDEEVGLIKGSTDFESRERAESIIRDAFYLP